MDSSNDEALDIIVTNVVATFRTRCHLNLRTIALEGVNVIYKPEVGVRKPKSVKEGTGFSVSLTYILNLYSFTASSYV